MGAVRNIDPIWGDCDHNPKIPHIKITNSKSKKHWPDLRGLRLFICSSFHFDHDIHVRNIDPIWGDCDGNKARHKPCPYLKKSKKHWPDLRGLRQNSEIIAGKSFSDKCKKHWPDLRGLRLLNRLQHRLWNLLRKKHWPDLRGLRLFPCFPILFRICDT